MIRLYQDRTLKSLADKIGEFYLAGGAALSLFYFQHRLSVDLDFFTPDFRPMRIKEIVESLEKALSRENFMQHAEQYPTLMLSAAKRLSEAGRL